MNNSKPFCQAMMAVLISCAAVIITPLAAAAVAAEPAAANTWQQLTAWLHDAPALVLVATFVVAPLAGVPLSALLVTLGLAFPFSVALVITAATLLAHHLLLLVLSKTAASRWLQQQLARRRLLPKSRRDKSFIDDVFFIVTATWVPGLSYVFKLGFVALANLPLRTYLVVSTLSQLLAALPFLLLGRAAEEGQFMWAALLIFSFVVLAWLIRHFVIKRRNTLGSATRSQESPSGESQSQ